MKRSEKANKKSVDETVVLSLEDFFINQEDETEDVHYIESHVVEIVSHVVEDEKDEYTYDLFDNDINDSMLSIVIEDKIEEDIDCKIIESVVETEDIQTTVAPEVVDNNEELYVTDIDGFKRIISELPYPQDVNSIRNLNKGYLPGQVMSTWHMRMVRGHGGRRKGNRR